MSDYSNVNTGHRILVHNLRNTGRKVLNRYPDDAKIRNGIEVIEQMRRSAQQPCRTEDVSTPRGQWVNPCSGR
jgi:hypothetical protein